MPPTMAGLEAYSANGTADCTGSPVTCTPEWSYNTGPLGSGPYGTQTGIAAVNGVIYVTTSSGLEAFDAAGQKNCSGSPASCQPLWSAPGAAGDPTVSGGTVYLPATGGLEAFDAAGVKNCSESPDRVLTDLELFGLGVESGHCRQRHRVRGAPR